MSEGRLTKDTWEEGASGRQWSATSLGTGSGVWDLGERQDTSWGAHVPRGRRTLRPCWGTDVTLRKSAGHRMARTLVSHKAKRFWAHLWHPSAALRRSGL